jgi:tetratricopeptide (TPR) repeat protein
MKFTEYLNTAWSIHASEPRKVADEIKQNFNLMESDEDVMSIIRLIVHVYGEHLGEWTKGIELLRKLKNNATIKDQSEMKRSVAILTLGNNPNLSIDEFSPSDQVRIYASTAQALAHLGGLKNAAKFLSLAAELCISQVTKEDLANKTLAMAGNNMACSLEEKIERNSTEIELMISAAKIGRQFWEIAGTWKEIERAEYRLAQTYLKAGLLDESLAHAHKCFEINTQNGSEPLEIFFSYEAIALVEKAQNKVDASLKSIEKMKTIFLSLSVDDQAWCQETLDKVQL